LKELARISKLNKISGAATFRGVHVQESCFVCHTLGLLQIVGHDGDGIPGLQTQASALRFCEWRSGRAPSKVRPLGEDWNGGITDSFEGAVVKLLDVAIDDGVGGI